MTATLTRLPRHLHEQADGSIVCHHRDVSCCPACLAADERLVDVYGAVYFITDPDERAPYVDRVTIDPADVPVVPGHRFRAAHEDVPEVCQCGAVFGFGFNVQAMKVAHLKAWAAETEPAAHVYAEQYALPTLADTAAEDSDQPTLF